MRPELFQAARQAVAEVELLSNGTTQTFDPDVAGVKKSSDSREPRNGHVSPPKRVAGEPREPSDRQPEIIVFRRRLANARTDEHLEAITADALRVAREIRYSKHLHVDVGTREGRLLVGLDPRDIETVMHIYGCSRSHVYKCKQEARHAA